MSGITRVRIHNALADQRTFRARTARFLVATATLAALAVPQTAFAWRADFDEVAGTPLSADAAPKTAAPDIDAAAGILVDGNGRALWARRGDERRAMASTTKMMTALLAIEHGGLDRKVTVSANASRVPYGLGLRPGEKRTVRELLQLTMVASSNDGAYALGEYVGGSMPAFVKKMNERARELGLKNTHFANPHGLDAKGHYSSPADLAKLAQTGMKKGEFRRVVRMRSVRMPGAAGRAPRTIKATDKLLGVYPGLQGVKTGFTNDAKHSFVSSATRNGVTLTTVILGAPTGAARFAETRELLDWGFRNVQQRQLATAGESAGELPVAVNPEHTVPVRLGESASARVFALGGEISREASLTANVALPVFEGQPLGAVKVKQGERVLAEVPALAATSTVSAEETVGAVPVLDFVDRTVTARAAAVASPAVPEFDPSVPVEQKVDLKRGIEAPVAVGDDLGTITYLQGERLIARVPVQAAEDVEAPGMLQSLATAFARGWRTLVGAPTVAKLQIVGA